MKFRFDETFPNFLLYADLPLFLPLFVELRKAFGLSPSSSLTPPSGFFFFFLAPPSYLCFLIGLSLKLCFLLIRLAEVPLSGLQQGYR